MAKNRLPNLMQLNQK